MCENLSDAVDLLLIVVGEGCCSCQRLVYRCASSRLYCARGDKPRAKYRLGIDYSDRAKQDNFAQGDIDNVSFWT